MLLFDSPLIISAFTLLIQGRAIDSDLRIDDISVSRVHSFLSIIDGQFFLEDNDSKFGTLIQLQRPIYINPDEEAELQVGRTVLNISMKKGR